ncbi:MAG: Crp/Fnr family transcriptional regulator, partial [Elusimicrobia bacterium]|nr:Crp/Fnr family transcriptional regulator [Elusimicrobiota bacterium]
AGLFVVCIGCIWLKKMDSQGRVLILDQLKCGQIIGETSLLAHEPYGFSAQALTDSVLAFIPADYIAGLWRNSPAFREKLLKHISQLACRCLEKNINLVFKSAESRLAEFLLKNLKTADGGASDCPYTSVYSRRDIAEILGLAPETVIRQLSAFKNSRLLTVSGKKIRILDAEGLRAVAAKQSSPEDSLILRTRRSM